MWDLFFGELFLLLIVFLVIRLLKNVFINKYFWLLGYWKRLILDFFNSFGEVNDRGCIGVCSEID